MGEILPDGTIQGYFNVCPRCGGDIEVNFQGKDMGYHECPILKTFILRKKNKSSEDDRYSYWVKTTMMGLELTTPFRKNATRVKENESIDVISKDWKFIKIKQSHEDKTL